MNPAFDVILPNTLETGARVRVLPNHPHHSGRCGYIVQTKNAFWGVQLDHLDDAMGHDLNGYLDLDSNDGWYFPDTALEVINE